jgi:hypothetical protein
MTNLDEINLAEFAPTNEEIRRFYDAVSDNIRSRIFVATAEKRMKSIPLFEKIAEELRGQSDEIRNTFRKVVKFWSFVDLPEF